MNFDYTVFADGAVAVTPAGGATVNYASVAAAQAAGYPVPTGATNTGSGVTASSTSAAATTTGGLAPAATVTAPAAASDATMPQLNKRLTQLAACIADDINALVAAENTAHGVLQGNIDVVAKNIEAVDAEVKALIADNLTTGSANTWSIDKINKVVADQIASALHGLTPDVIALLEQAAASITNDESAITVLLTQLSKAVRVDIVQVFSDAEKSQARQNIGALSASDVSASVTAALEASPLFVDVDLCAAYAAARAAG